MTHPEHPHLLDPFSDERIAVHLLLAEIDRRLELIEANENVIERHAQRDVLLEWRDSIEADREPEL